MKALTLNYYVTQPLVVQFYTQNNCQGEKKSDVERYNQRSFDCRIEALGVTLYYFEFK